jgi:hypothetical protein
VEAEVVKASARKRNLAQYRLMPRKPRFGLTETEFFEKSRRFPDEMPGFDPLKKFEPASNLSGEPRD